MKPNRRQSVRPIENKRSPNIVIGLISLILIVGASITAFWFYKDAKVKEEKNYILTVVIPQFIEHENRINTTLETQLFPVLVGLTNGEDATKYTDNIAKTLSLFNNLNYEIENIEFKNLSPDNAKAVNDYYVAMNEYVLSSMLPMKTVYEYAKKGEPMPTDTSIDVIVESSDINGKAQNYHTQRENTRKILKAFTDFE